MGVLLQVNNDVLPAQQAFSLALYGVSFWPASTSDAGLLLMR
ncbi:MAG: hypothetical protein UX01_C0010G0001, partial [Candidatus Collierbacteria bacterium GW2011_GWB2_45_17]